MILLEFGLPGAGFPRLSALQAADGFLPRQLTYRGSRLVFSRGILVLTGIACLLIFVFSASVTALIPLYAIGVFVACTTPSATYRPTARILPMPLVKASSGKIVPVIERADLQCADATLTPGFKRPTML